MPTPIEQLRAALRDRRAHAALIPISDPHLSEYVAPHWKVVRALTGFRGSTGLLAVSEGEAALATDSRYWEQARRELQEGIGLLPARGRLLDAALDWLGAHQASGGRVLADPALFSVEDVERLEAGLSARHLELVLQNPVGEELWPERPAIRLSNLWKLPRPGRSVGEKLAFVREKLREKECGALFDASLDNAAWLSNVRGGDIPHNPVFEASLVVTLSDALLMVEEGRLDDETARELAASGLRTGGEAEARELLGASFRVLFDPKAATPEHRTLWAGRPECRAASPVTLVKSRKNPAELELVGEAMVKDGVALVEFYAELDERLERGELLTEWDAREMLHGWRARDPDFFDESFGTIAAYGPNAAEPHYEPRGPEGAARLEGNGLLLVDSGGQYVCGTTDITRMTPVGRPGPGMKRDAARVLSGMLRLLEAKFPLGTTGSQIDALARMDLWKSGLDFGHGTGHGVGFVLNVHEGPVRISPGCHEPLAVGNVISDEPGLYRPGRWGVRIENLMCVEEAPGEEGFGPFCRMRLLTCCPIDARTIDLAALTPEMLAGLRAFNAEAFRKLSPRVSARARRWMTQAASRGL